MIVRGANADVVNGGSGDVDDDSMFDEGVDDEATREAAALATLTTDGVDDEAAAACGNPTEDTLI